MSEELKEYNDLLALHTRTVFGFDAKDPSTWQKATSKADVAVMYPHLFGPGYLKVIAARHTTVCFRELYEERDPKLLKRLAPSGEPIRAWTLYLTR